MNGKQNEETLKNEEMKPKERTGPGKKQRESNDEE